MHGGRRRGAGSEPVPSTRAPTFAGPPQGQEGPQTEYARRLRAWEQCESRLDTRYAWGGYLRLAAVAGFLAVAWFSIFLKRGSTWTLLLPATLFLALGGWMGRLGRKRSTARRSATFYRLGIARVEDRWVGLEVRDAPKGLSARVREGLERSLYAGDLDLTGTGGLFELLCRARTRIGEELLLEWLLAPAAVGEIRERQAAVEELRGRLDLRERMWVCGETAKAGVQAETLVRWAEAEDRLTQGWMPWVAGVLAILIVALLAATLWLQAGGSFGGGPLQGMSSPGTALALLLALAVAFLLRRGFQSQMEAVLHDSGEALESLELLSGLLRVMEAERFCSQRLQGVAGKLAAGSVAGSVAIARLARLGAWRDSMDDMVVRILNLPLLYSVQVAWAMQRWRRRHGGDVRRWLEAVAEMEALLSLAGFAYEHPEDVFPEVVETGAVRGDGSGAACSPSAGEKALLEVEEMGHPLIAASKCIRNSLRMSDRAPMLLITGSNMSGKSTLLRTVGVNAVLAMAGATVRARGMRLTPFTIGASLRVNDSLQEGQSRFYAEIEKLRRICKVADAFAARSGAGAGVDGAGQAEERPQPIRVLFLLDELLQGTNSQDRLLGAEGVMRELLEAGAMGLVTTHDLALAEMQGLPPGCMQCWHFQDQIVDGRMVFDFTLREGVAMKSNGVALMRLIGLRV